MPNPERFPVQPLISSLQSALVAAGLPAAIAAVEARLAVDADLMGVPSHGIGRVPLLLQGLKDGRTKPVPDLKLIKDKMAISVLDGDHGPGRYVATRAMADAMSRAKTFGIGACLAVRTSHWGRGHAYAAQAAAEGLIGICMTNAQTSMSGWGSPGKVLGNNPLAIGVPGLDSGKPIVLDMAMSQAAVGKVATWLREGKPIPGGWGLDAQGRPSSDAASVLQGAVLPMGDHKGAGLALMIQLMTAALAGGLLDFELRETDPTGLDSEASKLFIALDIEAFGELSRFRERSVSLVEWLQSHTGSPSEFLWPAERGWADRERNLIEGVPVHKDIVAQLAKAGIVLS